MRRRNKPDLTRMSSREKKCFLSMDLIERMIRVEQRVSASFGKPVAYNKTEYYKSLTENERKAFEAYLAGKSRQKLVLASLLLLPLAILAFLKIEATGSVVRQTVENPALIGVAEYAIMGFLILALVLFLIILAVRGIRRRRYNEHFDIIEDAFLKKHAISRSRG